MYVNPGELKKRIQIIRIKTDGINPNGFPVKREEVIRICQAKVTNESGSAILKAASEFSEAKKRFLVRYTPVGIGTDMVVRYEGKDYDIEYVNRYGDGKEYMEIWTSNSERA